METKPLRLLIVDDEVNIREGLRDALSGPEVEVRSARDGGEALRLLDEGPVHILVTDLRMPGEVGGLDLVRAVRERFPESTAIVISAFGTVESAVEAMRLGAADFVTKPINIKHIRLLVTRAVEKLRLLEENRRLKAELERGRGGGAIVIGESPAMKRVVAIVDQVATSDAHVFLTGESGTGKEVIARLLHERSERRKGPFVPVNCGAISETIFESEMFGHEPGAFTGATREKRGLFEAAHGGTIFLDEITEIAEKNQVDLLRVIQEKDIRRVGGDRRIAVDIRIVAASNRDVRRLVGEGAFRDDLYYRLSVVPIHLPPLRERGEDIPLLSDRFLKEFCARHDRPPKRIAPAAMRALAGHAWPGNIRQLRNVLEQLVVCVSGDEIALPDLPSEVRAPAAACSPRLRDVVGRAEHEAILDALQQAGNRREKAAEILGVSVRTLRYKLRRYGIEA
jgi:two-component system NtrC family response regulator